MNSSLPDATLAEPFSKAAPEDLGFAGDLGDKLEAGRYSGLLRGLHSVLVMRAGQLLLERYYEGPDEDWGHQLGRVVFDAETLHDMRSVTKSIVNLLYGVALERGLVAPPEAPLLEQFPDYEDLAADPERAALTIEHALTMSLGLKWNEGMSYRDPANHEIAMEKAEDRYRFVLDRPVVAPPGSRWTYSGGCSALLGGLIARGAGKPLDRFAIEALFEPLGITDFGWAQGPDGIHSAASGLRLRPRDLAKIGLLVLNGGRWDGRQLVPKDWLEASHRPAIATGDGLEYGRQWFLGADYVPAFGEKQRWIAAFGNGGQRLMIMPSAELLMVVTAGNYNSPIDWVYPMRIWREILLANLQGS